MATRAQRLLLLMSSATQVLAPSQISGLTGDFNAALGLFQDTGGTTPAVLGDDPVGLWKDQSGAARDISQGTGAQKPLLKLAQVNGLPGVQFDASNDIMSSSAAMSTFITNSAYTVMGVVKFVSTATNVTTPGSVYSNSAFWYVGGGYGGVVFRSPPNAVAYNYDGSEDVASGTIVAGSAFLLESRHDNGNIILKIGANAEVSTPSGNTSSLAAALNLGQSGAGMGAIVARLVLFNRVLSDAERTGLRNYFSSVYGVTV